ncbi:STAS-like domain-containing protein [Bacillus cereus group sp. BfR-BA-01489]|uniref:STAS-like domain-containing protein n=1 Tax=Bacillus cereus group sp. BfR-BA-01489 TaxID=2920358 RepID=UPI001F585B72
MNILVFDVVGESALSMQKGEKLYEMMIENLKSGKEVELDFNGVQKFASPFFNASIGRLLKDFTPEDLNRRMKFTNLNAVGGSLLRKSIKNSAEYFQDNLMKNAVDKAISNIEGDIK